MAIQTDLITDSTGLKSVNVGDVVDGHCTAWVNFDGTTGTIRNSFNVASVVRNAVGSYTITFATPMANARYAAPAGSSRNPFSFGAAMRSSTCDAFSTTSLNAYSHYITAGGAAIAEDAVVVSIEVFGGK